ncbi:MFS transporter [Burkholderia gladioli]|nr:MFS transporter [Burkholderia gladioli]NIE86869.1 MFS transporter [Burkholderia sp. Tr-860]NIF66778.1 MFS transporter [Burkholderia sp. Cy-647]NIF72860.1 MFS transporter [Burkholderia sp. Ap-962]NIF87026.1 MFS transporter [Burkholderia sp. Cy-637]NIF94253.1 MFS transporter [Burkholderia sp. Ax-1720]
MASSRPTRRLSATHGVLIVLCIMSFLMYVDRTNISTAALAIRRDLVLSNTQLGLVFSAFAITYALAMIPGGFIGDRLGARKMLAICGVLWGLGTLLTGLAGGFTTLLLARFVVGLGESPIVPASARALTGWMKPDQRGFAQGVTHACARLGNASTPILVAGLIAAFSWHAAFVILGLASLAWVVLWVWYYRDNPADHPAISAEELARLPAKLGKTRVPMRWSPLLRALWPATVVSFCHGWILWFFLNWMPSFFAQAYHLNIRHSAIFSSGIFLSGVVGTTLGGSLSDLLLKRTGNIRRSRQIMITIGFLAPIVFFIPMFLHPSATMAGFSLAAALFLSELVTAPLWAVAMDLAPNHAATSSSIMNTGLGLAASVSPPLVGWLVDALHSWEPVFALSIFFLVLGPIAANWIRPDRPYLGERGSRDSAQQPAGLAPQLDAS